MQVHDAERGWKKLSDRVKWCFAVAVTARAASLEGPLAVVGSHARFWQGHSQIG
jgi:hypothetical protein